MCSKCIFDGKLYLVIFSSVLSFIGVWSTFYIGGTPCLTNELQMFSLGLSCAFVYDCFSLEKLKI